MAVAGLLVAIGVAAAPIVSLPIGPSRVYPLQATIDVLAGVILGPWPAVGIAIVVSALRLGFGTGTPLAFPGSIFGALLAGYLYLATRRDALASVGEIIGTGLIGAIVSFPIAHYVMGRSTAAFFFVIPFALASGTGAVLGYIVLKALRGARLLS
ncbi:MAG TPA: energy coupling factor transporter S component ThiW [Bacillota bacterium]|nr:energy coupling factor transporter S component ThiW [Bacillota bacterium]